MFMGWWSNVSPACGRGGGGGGEIIFKIENDWIKINQD